MSLRLGSPLPESTPGPLLDRLLYHEEKRRHRRRQPSDSRVTTNTGTDSDDEPSHPKVEGATIGTRLSFKVLQVRASLLASWLSAVRRMKQLIGFRMHCRTNDSAFMLPQSWPSPQFSRVWMSSRSPRSAWWERSTFRDLMG